jgi:hypothetical protein
VAAGVDEDVARRPLDRGQCRVADGRRLGQLGQPAAQREPVAGQPADQRGVAAELRAAVDVDRA